MNTKAQDTAKLEVRIEAAQEGVRAMETFLRLAKNEDFKTVIEKDYFESYAVMLVDNLADEELQSPEQQALINNSLRSIGELKAFFRKTIQIGRQMQSAILAANHELDHMDDKEEFDSTAE